jgi:hypothetical protein
MAKIELTDSWSSPQLEIYPRRNKPSPSQIVKGAKKLCRVLSSIDDFNNAEPSAFDQIEKQRVRLINVKR